MASEKPFPEEWREEIEKTIETHRARRIEGRGWNLFLGFCLGAGLVYTLSFLLSERLNLHIAEKVSEDVIAEYDVRFGNMAKTLSAEAKELALKDKVFRTKLQAAILADVETAMQTALRKQVPAAVQGRFRESAPAMIGQAAEMAHQRLAADAGFNRNLRGALHEALKPEVQQAAQASVKSALPPAVTREFNERQAALAQQAAESLKSDAKLQAAMELNVSRALEPMLESFVKGTVASTVPSSVSREVQQQKATLAKSIVAELKPAMKAELEARDKASAAQLQALERAFFRQIADLARQGADLARQVELQDQGTTPKSESVTQAAHKIGAEFKAIERKMRQELK